MSKRRPTSGVDSILPRRMQGTGAGASLRAPRLHGVDAIQPRRVQDLEQDIARVTSGDDRRPRGMYPAGTYVRLPDGSIGKAFPEHRVGDVWHGTYRVEQGGRSDYWHHEQLTPIRP